MKKYFFLFLILLATPASAGFESVIQYYNAAGGATCSTPQTGNLLSEGFIGGYENGACGDTPCWTETIGTNGTVTENYTLSGTPPSSACSNGLYTASAANAGNSTYAWWNNGSTIALSDNITISGSFRVNSWTLPTNGDVIAILNFTHGEASTGALTLRLVNASDTLQIRGQANTQSTAVSISTETWYNFVLYGDGTTAANSYFQIDAGTTCDTASECTFTRNTNDPSYLTLGPSILNDSDEAVAIEWGAVWISTETP